MAQDSSKPDFWDTRYDAGVMPWDAGKVPADLVAFARELAPGCRVLVPGCGSGHEVVFLADAGFDVLAIDFSPPAIELAHRNAARFTDRIVLADFFEFDAGAGFDVIYERAFLCALPRGLWTRYGERMADIVRPGGCLAGFWFMDDNERGPPFGTNPAQLESLLAPAFALELDVPANDSLPVFAGRERWQTWRRDGRTIPSTPQGR